MDSSTKKMVKTFGMIVGALVIVFIVLFIVMGIGNRKVNNAQLLNTLESAAKKYYADHKDELPIEGAEAKVTADTLIAGNYMKSFDKLTKNTGCNGEVTVTNNGEYTYLPKVSCSNYKSSGLADKLKENVITVGDGLHKIEDAYYFKGEYVNNYVKLGDSVYRIMSIDSKGNIKVINPVLSKDTYAWDDRYNIDRDENGLGINEYEKSRIRENLVNLYKSYSKNAKKYILNYKWCVDKLSNLEINTKCENYIDDYLGIIDAREFAIASLDNNCTDVLSNSCQNYNYLAGIFNRNVWTINALATNSYEVYAITSNNVLVKKTNGSARYAESFYISGDNAYTSGDGSKENPYILR